MYTLPRGRWGRRWAVEIDTADDRHRDSRRYHRGESVTIDARSVLVLRGVE